MSGHIIGNLILPPKTIKDAEGVGMCVQVFSVTDCQPKSVEVAIANPEVNKGILLNDFYDPKKRCFMSLQVILIILRII